MGELDHQVKGSDNSIYITYVYAGMFKSKLSFKYTAFTFKLLLTLS